MLLASLMFLFSCGKKSLTAEILQIQSRPIDLTAGEDAVCYENGERTSYRSGDSAYKLIIYIDSTSCSPCFISHMQDYIATVEELDSVGIRTVLIFEPVRERVEDVKTSLEQQSFPFQTVVVDHTAFFSDNQHLPSYSLLHSFLLNRKNEVVIVGNPVRNTKVKELMLNTVKSLYRK